MPASGRILDLSDGGFAGHAALESTNVRPEVEIEPLGEKGVSERLAVTERAILRQEHLLAQLRHLRKVTSTCRAWRRIAEGVAAGKHVSGPPLIDVILDFVTTD